ncbi:MAG: 6-phosphogluconolactonase [Candidatus Xenobia bacterium]
MSRRIIVCQDLHAIVFEMAEWMVKLAHEAIAARGRFTLALSGGSTPRDLYAKLASEEFRNRFDWSKVQFFFGDERSVPPDHKDSNFKMATDAMLSKIPVPPDNVHRMEAERQDRDQAAREYEQVLKKYFAGQDFPRFDLVLLGMGPDGHTASLFPGTEALQEKTRWVVPNFVAKMDTWRMTMTYPLLNAAHLVAFMAAGPDKADMLVNVLQGPEQYPCQGVKPTQGQLVWMIDQAASLKLDKNLPGLEQKSLSKT